MYGEGQPKMSLVESNGSSFELEPRTSITSMIGLEATGFAVASRPLYVNIRLQIAPLNASKRQFRRSFVTVLSRVTQVC